MKRILSTIVAVLLMLGLSLGPAVPAVAAAPVDVVAGPGTLHVFPLTLDTKGEATAEWSYDVLDVSKSAHLETTGTVGAGNEARVVIPLAEGTTLGDIDSIFWGEYLVAGYPPHVDISLDIDGDGVVDDKLVFEYAYNSETHCTDEAPMPYGALTGDWYDTFSDDGNGPGQVDDTANGWLSSGPPGPLGGPNFIYGTLADWKAGTVDATINATALVPILEIEVDNWVVQSEAFVDEIAINGIIQHGGRAAHLETTGTVGDGNEARVVIPLAEGTTLGDIDSILWWEYLVTGYPPHVDISLDINGDGVVDDKLVFEYAYNS
ncbi:hypothetical protein ACFLTZ_07205, partial [Chloroflexota bacterium]